MNKDKQRIAIAEACGWTREYADVPTWNGKLNNYKGAYEPIHTVVFRLKEKCVIAKNLPDYSNDLNAMREVENIFVQNDGCVWGDEWELYCKYLAHICCMAVPTNCLARATSAQRAEAFLRTLNLWEEDK